MLLQTAVLVRRHSRTLAQVKMLLPGADSERVSVKLQPPATVSWRWLLLYVVVVAFNVSSVVAEVRGIALVIRDESFRNAVMYAALVINVVLLLVGIHLARRIRPNLIGRA